MDYEEVKNPLEIQLYGRLGEQINIMEQTRQELQHHVYRDWNVPGSLPRYELFRRLKFLLKDTEFTTVFLEKALDESERNRDKIKGSNTP